MSVIIGSLIDTKKRPQVVLAWLEWIGKLMKKSNLQAIFLVDGKPNIAIARALVDTGAVLVSVEAECPWTEDNTHKSRRVAWLREGLRTALLRFKWNWDWLWLVDCDTFPPMDGLAQLMAAATEGDLPLASGLVPDRWRNDVVVALEKEVLALPNGIEKVKAPARAQWTGFACFLCAREVLERQGWRDYGNVEMDGYPRHGEDTWWCRRAGSPIALALDCCCLHADNNLTVGYAEWKDGKLSIGRREPLLTVKTKPEAAIRYVGGGKAKHPVIGKVVLGEVIQLTDELVKKLHCDTAEEAQQRLCFEGDPPHPNHIWEPATVQAKDKALDLRGL